MWNAVFGKQTSYGGFLEQRSASHGDGHTPMAEGATNARSHYAGKAVSLSVYRVSFTRTLPHGQLGIEEWHEWKEI